MNTEPGIGEPVTLRQRKWDGAAHRQARMLFLGSDQHGGWLANADGSPFPFDAAEAGTELRRRAAHAMLIPRTGGFLAHFNAPPHRTALYADVTTVPEFSDDGSGWAIRAVDLDLDVVAAADGRCWIEDEDEFAAHTVRYRYPETVVAGARATADELLAAVRAGSEPFGTAWRHWVDRAATVNSRP
ncbi:DUF402 domain-containing protein [Microlunatus sp. GCM10028923]|uniref:DUF402 domain-containing protein n=1 Tax=Microlunatus sp. GCM10028923 TaxID=3273400 RepID=UPI00360B4434